ncbi:MAG: T9SS type A sorting domain-containing protein [Bacteroidota bacterium]
MRKSLLILQLLLCLVAKAQQITDTQVASQTNTVFSLLEKNRVPHQILLDYGYDFVDATQYDGVLRSNNYLSPGIYRQLYNTMLSSRVNTSVPELEAPEDLESAWSSKRKSETNKFGKGSPTSALVLNGLYYKYSRIRSNALSQNDIRVTNGKYDDVYVSGTWQNPYETKTSFGMALPVQQIANSKISLLLSNETWYTNQSPNVHSFAVNFGDGSGYKAFSLGNALLHTYANDGNYTVTFRLRLTNGQYLYCRNRLKVTGAARQNALSARDPGCNLPNGSFPLEFVTATRSFQGIAGSATLQIAYANTCGQITKPLIVAEGLDTGLQQEGATIGDSDIEQFFQFVDNSGSQSLIDLVSTTNTAITNDFDVIYVNWDNGVDDLRRNAFVLQRVIEWVNQQKAISGSTTPNVVLGQSMGGVIARYALRDMENRNEDHDTNLYISHDAPHQGAHIPLGSLYFARQMLNEVIATPAGSVGVPLASGEFSVGDIEDLLDAPAVKQLLRQYVRKDYVRDNDVHDTWQSELQSMGYPQQTRNVALSNASHCAEGYGLSSNQQLFRINGSGSTKGLQDILFGTLGGLFTGIATGDIATALLGVLPGNSKLEADFRIKAYPSSGTANIYSGRITYTKKLLWLIRITRTFTRRNFDSPSGVLLQDNFPGGSNLFINQLSSESGSGGNFFGNFGYNFDVVDDVNFITAVSALDVGSGATVLNASDYTRTYTQTNRPTGNRAIPFVNFTTSFNNNSENEIHLSFNSRNGDWLADELDNAASTFNCGFVCSSVAISGPSDFCSSATFSVPAANGSVTWSISPSTALNFQQNQASTTFSQRNGYRGNVTITANISGAACGVPNVNVSKQIYVGRPLTYAGPVPDVCTNVFIQPETFTLPASPGADTYRLTSSSPFLTIDGSSSRTYTNAPTPVNFMGTSPGTYTVTLQTTNSCGTSTVSFPVKVVSCGGGGFFSVYPNPSNSGTFFIGERSSESIGTLSAQTSSAWSNSSSFGRESINKPEKYSFEIYDRFGRLLFEKRDQDWNGNIELNLERYGNGIYFLRILGKESEETHQILLDKG